MAEKKPLGLYDSCINPYVRTGEGITTDPGSPIHKTYKLVINEDGTHDFIETGAINIYDEIQSHRESVDLALMIKRYEQGDESAFDRVKGFYLDTVGMPQTLAEVLQRVEDSRALFESLPPEMRDEFNHDPNQFFANIEKYVKANESNTSESKPKDTIPETTEEGVKPNE